KARQAIKGISSAPLGITLAMQEFLIDASENEYSLASAKRDSAWAGLEDPFFEVARGDDFFGVQTYTRQYFGVGGRIKPSPETRVTMLGYEFCPESLEGCIRRAWEQTGSVPILVTENGIATTQDSERIEYVHGALKGVLRCLSDGIDVRGYTYWSLLDNFEWIFGYEPTFGLVGVNRKTQQRVPKPSASWLGQVARANALLPVGHQ
ncbi:MAG: family 1 glycosylhydrolase, partial [Ilumatobacteraceae bacterium]